MAANFNDRRRFPIIAAILNVLFLIALTGLILWISIIDSRLRTVSVLQSNVLESNLRFGEQCSGIKTELSTINEQLNAFLPCLIRREQDRD